jgi:hypothetical protein
VIIPPTMGAAMRRMTSEPAPWPSMIGKRPAMMTATVMALGRTRSTAPSMIAALRSAMVQSVPASRSALRALSRYTSMTTPNSVATPAKAMALTAATATDRL